VKLMSPTMSCSIRKQMALHTKALPSGPEVAAESKLKIMYHCSRFSGEVVWRVALQKRRLAETQQDSVRRLT
jgi:hypothetical protein